jgi:hypothetical protein
MKKIVSYLKYVLLFSLFIVATQPFFLKAQSNSELAQWTVMIYMAADNNLEGFALYDIAEMELNGSTDDVNVVVQVDRARGFAGGADDWIGARRYYITKSKGTGINSELVENLGDTNMGAAGTLAEFGKWAMTTYPAERYALILWDHGGSWVGFAHDSGSGNDSMTMDELDSALADITRSTGVDKLDIIGFDACLMGGYEVYKTLEPYAHYALASETLIPGFGWDYDFSLLDLTENPEMDAVEFGTKIVDNFMLFYDNQSVYEHYNLSLVDLNAMGQLDEGLAALGSALTASTTSPESVTLARNATIRFGSLGSDFTRDFNSTLGLIDIFDFAANISNYSDDANLISAAQELLAVRDLVVLQHQASPSLQRSQGMSFYFPTNQIRPQPDDNTIRYGTSLDNAWAQAILEFYTNLALYGGNPNATFGADVNGTNLSIPVESTNFDVMQQSVFTVSGGQIVNYETVDPSEQVAWQPQTTLFTYGDTAENVVTFSSDKMPDAYSVQGRITNPFGETIDVEWYFDAETGEPGAMWALIPDPTGTVLYSEYNPYPGDTLQLYTYSLEGSDVTVDVSPVSYPVGDTDEEDYQVTQTEAGDGDYTVVVVLSDVAGQKVHTEVEVEVNGGQLNVVSQTTVEATATQAPVIVPTNTPVPLVSGGTCNPNSANWCLPGQPWGDGRCDSDDPNITAYNYQLGWYNAAYACEVIDSFPPQFAPPTSAPEDVAPTPCPTYDPMYPNC